jgi:hypothetical protein
MWKDPIVEEVRNAREEHAARFNYDLKAIFKDIQAEERRGDRRFVSLEPRRPLEVASEGSR